MKKPQAKDIAAQALEDALMWAEAGDYTMALERHLWFHQNALEVNAGYYGVRLSYALKYWKILGEVYPAAIEAMVELRDKTAEELLGGVDSPAKFDDVRAFNECLGVVPKTLELFRTMAVAYPLNGKKCFKHVVDAIVAEGDGALYMEFSSDPKMQIAQEIVNFNRAIRHIADHAPRYDDSIKEFENHLAGLSVAVSGFLEESGDAESANEIREEVLTLVEDKRLRDALKEK